MPASHTCRRHRNRHHDLFLSAAARPHQGPRRPRLGPVVELALRARDLFRRLDYALWRDSAHNPVRMLRLMSPERLEEVGPATGRSWRSTTTWCATCARRDRARQPGGARTFGDSQRPDHRLLLRRVRPAPVAADLRRRPRRARRRQLQGSERPRPAVRRRRVHVPAGLLPPEGHRPTAGRTRPTSTWTGTTRRSQPAITPTGERCVVQVPLGTRTVHAAVWQVQGRPRAAAAARHRPRRERAVGPRAVRAPVRRQPGNAHPAGNRPRPRRRARAARRWASSPPCGT